MPSDRGNPVATASAIAFSLLMALSVSAQQQPAGAPPQSTPKPAQPATGNPFPEDTVTVPVMPNATTAAQPEANENIDTGRVALPGQDTDPARSPDDAVSSAPSAPGNESTSSIPDIDRIQPKDDESTKRKGKQKDVPEFKETAAGDIDVAKYYLERKDWKAALSRLQSAMILDPENPEVFWGMAESARHLGDFASAKSYYLRVVDFDPDSRHGKDARKALKDPEIANAQNSAASQPKK